MYKILHHPNYNQSSPEKQKTFFVPKFFQWDNSLGKYKSEDGFFLQSNFRLLFTHRTEKLRRKKRRSGKHITLKFKRETNRKICNTLAKLNGEFCVIFYIFKPKNSQFKIYDQQKINYFDFSSKFF